MRTSPYLPFAIQSFRSPYPSSWSRRVLREEDIGTNVDTPDLEPLHSVLISHHPRLGLIVAMACVTWRGP